MRLELVQPAATITAALVEAHGLTSDDVAETFVGVYDQLILAQQTISQRDMRALTPTPPLHLIRRACGAEFYPDGSGREACGQCLAAQIELTFLRELRLVPRKPMRRASTGNSDENAEDMDGSSRKIA